MRNLKKKIVEKIQIRQHCFTILKDITLVFEEDSKTIRRGTSKKVSTKTKSNLKEAWKTTIGSKREHEKLHLEERAKKQNFL